MPTNWTPQTANPPSQAQDVCIPTGTPNAPVIGPAPSPFTEATARTISSAELIDVQSGGILHLFNGTEESILQDGITLGDSTTLNAAGPVTVHGDLAWNGNNATIKGGTGAARRITIASDGTLTEATGPGVQRILDTGTLRIEGSATFEGNTDGNFHQTGLANGADIEVGGASGPRTLDLQDDQLIFDFDGSADSVLRVLAGGTLTRTSAAGSASADVQVPVENDGTVTAAAGTTTWLSGGSSGNSGQWSPAAGAFVNFAGGTHSIGGSTIAGAGTVYGSYEVASGQTTVNGNYRWDNATTIGGAGTTLIAPSGTLTAPTGAGVQRILDTGTLRIEGSATFEGNTDGNFHQTLLANGADIEVGGASGPRTLDLQDDQLIFDGDGSDDSSLHVLAGGTLTRTSAGGSAIADVQISVENDGTVSSGAGILGLSGGSGGQTSAGQYSPATGAVVGFGGGTHLLAAGAAINGPGTTTITSGAVSASGATTVAANAVVSLAGGTLASGAGGTTVHGTLFWDNNGTIGDGTTTIASDGTLTAPAGPAVQRILDTGTLRIEGSATFEGNTDGNFHQTLLANGADIEVGGASGPRTLDLQDDQLIFDGDGGADSVLHVLAGGTLTRTSAAGSATADVQIPVENDGTVTAAAGTTTWLSGGSSGNSGQWSPAAGAFVNFAGGTHSIGGSTIAGAGTVYGSYEVASAQTLTVNGNYRWDNNTTIGGAGTTLIAPSGTLTAPTGAGVQRILDTGTLRIEGSATFEGNTDGNFHQDLLANGADIEVGGASGPRTLDLQDDQLIFDGDGGADSALRVLAGGTLTRTQAGGGGVADIAIVLTVNGTLNVAAGVLASTGTLTTLQPDVRPAFGRDLRGPQRRHLPLQRRRREDQRRRDRARGRRLRIPGRGRSGRAAQPRRQQRDGQAAAARRAQLHPHRGLHQQRPDRSRAHHQVHRHRQLHPERERHPGDRHRRDGRGDELRPAGGRQHRGGGRNPRRGRQRLPAADRRLLRRGQRRDRPHGHLRDRGRQRLHGQLPAEGGAAHAPDPLGGQPDGHRGQRGDHGRALPRRPLEPQPGHGHGQLRDEQRLRHGPRRLHGDLGHADLHPRPDVEDVRRAGGRRPARRGERALQRHAQQPAVRRPGRSERDRGRSPTTTRRRRSRSTTSPEVRAAPRTASTSPSRAPAASR